MTIIHLNVLGKYMKRLVPPGHNNAPIYTFIYKSMSVSYDRTMSCYDGSLADRVKKRTQIEDSTPNETNQLAKHSTKQTKPSRH